MTTVLPTVCVTQGDETPPGELMEPFDCALVIKTTNENGHDIEVIGGGFKGESGVYFQFKSSEHDNTTRIRFSRAALVAMMEIAMALDDKLS